MGIIELQFTLMIQLALIQNSGNDATAANHASRSGIKCGRNTPNGNLHVKSRLKIADAVESASAST